MMRCSDSNGQGLGPQAGAISEQIEKLKRDFVGKGGAGSPEWRVIGVDAANNRALAITENIVAKMPYHQPGGAITWEGCTLRRWLNSEFYDGLPAHIKSRVVEMTNQNPDNPYYGTAGGAPTRDKVFLLSIDEVNRYFKDDDDRVAKYEGTDDWWWLRSPGYDAHYAVRLEDDGDMGAIGSNVGYDIGTRPALWLSL